MDKTRVIYSEEIEEHNLSNQVNLTTTFTYYDEQQQEPKDRLTEIDLKLLSDVMRSYFVLPVNSYERKVYEALIMNNGITTKDVSEITGIRRDYLYRVYARMLKACPVLSCIIPAREMKEVKELVE